MTTWSMVEFNGKRYQWWEPGQSPTRNVWRLSGARQARYGIDFGSTTGFITIRDAGFDDLVLSVEVGTPVEIVATIPDDAIPQQAFDLLCELEDLDWSWDQENERRRLEWEEEQAADLLEEQEQANTKEGQERPS